MINPSHSSICYALDTGNHFKVTTPSSFRSRDLCHLCLRFTLFISLFFFYSFHIAFNFLLKSICVDVSTFRMNFVSFMLFDVTIAVINVIINATVKGFWNFSKFDIR